MCFVCVVVYVHGVCVLLYLCCGNVVYVLRVCCVCVCVVLCVCLLYVCMYVYFFVVDVGVVLWMCI